ncbi:MAG: hypothetical protein AB7G12_13800 [Thermoanaerobaculia bacterium]
MIAAGRLKDLLASPDYSNLEKLLICMATEPLAPRQVKEVREMASSAGLRKVRNWNISNALSSAGELAVRTAAGWELTTQGMRRVAELVGPVAAIPAQKVAASLRAHLSKVSQPETKKFVEEAVLCFEARHYRAAVVLSWVGAVSVLQDFVLTKKLSEFNSEATRRDKKWRTATTRDDLSRIEESEFLLILSALSVIGRNVRQELEVCLQLRNACGHPNSLQLGEARVAAHVETLLLNVFAKY